MGLLWKDSLVCLDCFVDGFPTRSPLEEEEEDAESHAHKHLIEPFIEV